MKRLTIGILAHVDSGKTTLSESLLFKTGQIRKLGRVDNRDTFLDTHFLEKDRGITIFSKQANFDVNNTQFTLLDTPGHVDFSTETERSLQVLDYAILVISSTSGVQSHTQTLWKLLERYRIPTFIFINKMDLSGADFQFVLSDLKSRLSSECIDFSENIGFDSFCEEVAMCDEVLMEEYLHESSFNDKSIAKAIANRKLFPCYFGSALKLDGIDELLNAIDKYTVEKKYKDNFSAKVFKITKDELGNRLTHLKITGGTLKVKSEINYSVNDKEYNDKINQVRIYSGAKHKLIDVALSGQICAVTGLTATYPGQGLGEEVGFMPPMLQSVINYKMSVLGDENIAKVLSDLKILQEEDPELHVIWNERLSEIHVRLMGQVQMEILKGIISSRFGYEVEFDSGSILYKESITSTTEGVGHFEPLRHYSEVHLLLSPNKAGVGITVTDDCSDDTVSKSLRRAIIGHINEKIHIGVLTGSPITDINISLVAARSHEKHTSGGDFREATYRAIRSGLAMADSVLLEPYYEFKIDVPTEHVGRVMFDLGQMHADFSPPDTSDNSAVITGIAPVYTMRDYSIKLSGYTQGQGGMVTFFCGYFPCHNSAQVIEEIAYDFENDLENTADSVFCSHGTSFIVKWHKISEYMHIDTGLTEKKVTTDYIDSTPTYKVKTSAPKDSLEAEKELLQIFERTYGEVRRSNESAFGQERKKVQKLAPLKPQKVISGPEFLLIDGYNIIFAWEELHELARDNIEAARNKLIDMLDNYQGYRKCEIIIVFDAYKVKGNVGEVEKVNNLSVVYTKEAETADMYIEKVTHKLSKQHRVRVATSDYMEQLIILGHGAFRVSASAFYEEVKEIEKQIREIING